MKLQGEKEKDITKNTMNSQSPRTDYNLNVIYSNTVQNEDECHFLNTSSARQ